jgi:hypothetical protein
MNKTLIEKCKIREIAAFHLPYILAAIKGRISIIKNLKLMEKQDRMTVRKSLMNDGSTDPPQLRNGSLNNSYCHCLCRAYLGLKESP